MKYCTLPLGCQMNKSDSERIDAVLQELGYDKTDVEEEADLLGIVSCSVRQTGIDRVYGKVAKWNRWKNKRNLLTFVSGCILPEDEKKFLKQFDLLFKIDDLPKLPGLIAHYGVTTPLQGIARKRAGIRSDFEGAFWQIEPRYASSFQAFVPIQNGCDKFCTFCAVPYTRGREISRPSSDILAEIDSLVARGYKSITLLGQNVNSYGRDKKGGEINFVQLLEAVGEIGERSGEKFWVYFTAPNPQDMTDDVIEAIARYGCLGKQIHLPLQSGDDGVLQKMNRSYRLENFRSIVQTIRRLIPSATLFTDIIVGFAGESDEQFENTRRTFPEFQYNMAYVAQYSPRPGAVSARWEETVSPQEKKRRYEVLTRELHVTGLAQNTKMIGHTFTVLVEGEDRKEGFLSARTEGRIIVRFASPDKSLIGTFVKVTVTSVTSMSAEGALAPTPQGVRLYPVPSGVKA